MPRPYDDSATREAAAVVVLLRAGDRPPPHYAGLIEEAGSAQAVAEHELGLIAAELIRAAAAEVSNWTSHGLRLLTVLDDTYPENLRAVHDRPPLIFIAGDLKPADRCAVAVIGSRRASRTGIERARAFTEALIASGYTVVSGLAAGIDTIAHTTALEHGARTIAVIGTGLDRCYPPQNASLQRSIATAGAVVSQFWPDAGPSRESFPLRNAVMSGLALATVIAEASATSGARIQARHALGHGRPVLLANALLDQQWASELAAKPGVHPVGSASELTTIVERLSSTEAPVA
jgi:DNA processing protein